MGKGPARGCNSGSANLSRPPWGLQGISCSRSADVQTVSEATLAKTAAGFRRTQRDRARLEDYARRCSELKARYSNEGPPAQASPSPDAAPDAAAAAEEENESNNSDFVAFRKAMIRTKPNKRRGVAHNTWLYEHNPIFPAWYHANGVLPRRECTTMAAFFKDPALVGRGGGTAPRPAEHPQHARKVYRATSDSKGIPFMRTSVAEGAYPVRRRPFRGAGKRILKTRDGDDLDLDDAAWDAARPSSSSSSASPSPSTPSPSPSPQQQQAALLSRGGRRAAEMKRASCRPSGPVHLQRGSDGVWQSCAETVSSLTSGSCSARLDAVDPTDFGVDVEIAGLANLEPSGTGLTTRAVRSADVRDPVRAAVPRRPKSSCSTLARLLALREVGLRRKAEEAQRAVDC